MTDSCGRSRPLLLGLALAIVALIGVACAPSPSIAPTPLSTTAGNATPGEAAASTAVAVVTVAPGGELDLPVGVDAEGNFYRGDPNAAVKLVEYSDFQ